MTIAIARTVPEKKRSPVHYLLDICSRLCSNVHVLGRDTLRKAVLILVVAIAFFEGANRKPEVAHFVGHVAHAMAVK